MTLEKTRRLKPRLHRRNPPPRVEENQKNGRLKPRLHKQNLPPQVEENRAVEITLFSLVREGGHRLCRCGFNRTSLESAEADIVCVDANSIRRLIQSAEADMVCLDAVSTAILSFWRLKPPSDLLFLFPILTSSIGQGDSAGHNGGFIHLKLRVM